MHQKLFLILSFFLAGILSCNAQQKDANSNAENNRTLVWEINGDGLSKPSYLMGTIHIICKEDYFWTDAMQKALNNTEKVCMEMDMDDMGLQMKVGQAMMLPEGKSLKDFFTEAEYKKVAEYAEKTLSLPSMMISKMKPVMLYTMMSTKAIECPVTESYEMNIMSKAKANKTEIIGLETADEQIAALDKMNADSVAHYIVESIDNKGVPSIKETAKLMDAYKQQDLDALTQLMLQSEQMAGGLDALLYERNKKWIPIMTDIARRQATLFAVGAGHLGGENGVIELLRKAGFKVTPVH